MFPGRRSPAPAGARFGTAATVLTANPFIFSSSHPIHFLSLPLDIPTNGEAFFLIPDFTFSAPERCSR